MVSASFIAIATLAVFALLGFALHPLWRARRVAGIAMIATLAVATAALYLLVGTPAALDPARRTPDDPLTVAIAELETRMRTAPDAEGWRLLARSYASQQRTTEARDALARAVALAPDDADVLAEAAESRAIANTGRRFDTQSIAWLEHAVDRKPDHQRARWFLGIARRQQQRPKDAAETWAPLLAQVDARTAASLRPQIDAARKEAGLPPLADDTPAPSGIAVRVRLDPALVARLTPDARVFVLARVPGGPPMPVAVETLAPSALPNTVTLDDGDSPMPTRTLSQVGEVEVLARISLRGVANAAPGDLVSASARASGGDAIDLVIDRAIE